MQNRFSLSAILALACPAALVVLLVLLDFGMRGNLNPVEAGIYLLAAMPGCLIGGLVASTIAVVGHRKPRWAGITGLAINGAMVVYLAIWLLLSA